MVVNQEYFHKLPWHLSEGSAISEFNNTFRLLNQFILKE